MKSRIFHPIAIIGYGCVYPPDGYDEEKFWDVILSGKSGIRTIPDDRWKWTYYYDEERAAEDKTYCKLGADIKSYQFPYKEYKFNKNELKNLNRAQLLLLDSVLQALNKAGMSKNSVKGQNIGMYIGNMLGDEFSQKYSLNYRMKEFLYYLEQNDEFGSMLPDVKDSIKKQFISDFAKKFPGIAGTNYQKVLHSALGKTVHDILGIEGLTTIVDAACSAGTLVIDEAVRGLQNRIFKTCMASGVLANMDVTGNVAFAKIGGLSPNHSRPLDASANGLIPGEGVGTVILKRLDDALNDGNSIYSIIRGIGSASDGKGKSIYAPSVVGQLTAMQKSLDKAGFKPRDIDYIETHATGTFVGDKVEMETLKQLFANENIPKQSVAIGSVKSQIGHSFSAAGMANLIKVILGMKNKVLPPTHNYSYAPSEVKLDESPFYVNTAVKEWPVRESGEPRRAAVNAFGFGGINASILIEEYQEEYHRKLLALLKSQETNEDAETDIAIVGIGCIDNKANSKDEIVNTLSGSVKVSDQYPGERWNAEANEIFNNDEEHKISAGFIENFKFPWKKYRTPPAILPEIDKSQLMALTAAGEAIEDYGSGKMDGFRTGVFVGAMLGLESCSLSGLRIRFVEYLETLKDIPEFNALSAEKQNRMIDFLTAKYRSYLPRTGEDSLPGYMDNIIAGRIANYFNIHGTNLVTDGDSASFMHALFQGVMSLESGEYDTIIVGGVHGNMTPEFLALFELIQQEKKSKCPYCEAHIADSVPSEGAVFFIMKKFAAVTENDKVYARIKGVYPQAASNGSDKSNLFIESVPDTPGDTQAMQRVCCTSLRNEAGKHAFYFGAQAGFMLLNAVSALHNAPSHREEAGAKADQAVELSCHSLLGGDFMLRLEPKDAVVKRNSKDPALSVSSRASQEKNSPILYIGAKDWAEMTARISTMLEQRKISSDDEGYALNSNYRLAIVYTTEDELFRKLKMVG